MTPSSAKKKGRGLAKRVAAWLVALGDGLTERDVHATNSGVTGKDVTMSEAAHRQWPFAIECKKHAAFAVYAHYDQATANAAGGEAPVLVIEANHRKPLAIVDAEWFFQLYRRRA